jgi:hypothetical protein
MNHRDARTASDPVSSSSDVAVLVRRLYEVVDEFEQLFPGRRFTPDGHLVGSIGEVLAADAFGLTLMTASNEGYDALTASGLRVEIKATQGISVSLAHVEKLLADRLIVLKLDRHGAVEVVYNGPAEPVWLAAGRPQKNGQRRISLDQLRRLDALVTSSGRVWPTAPRSVSQPADAAEDVTRGP